MSSANLPIRLPTQDQVIDLAPLTVEPNTDAITAIALMNQTPNSSDLSSGRKLFRDRHSCILVVEALKPVGILTAQDVVKLIGAGVDLSSVKIAEVMTQPVITLSQSEAQNILAAWSLLRQHSIRHLPIVNEQGELLGLLTQDDLLKWLDPLENATPATSQNVRELQSALHATALHESQLHELELLTDFVENAIICLHWVAADGTIIWANQAELDLLGYTREEYIGHSITEFHVNQIAIEDILQRLLSNQPVQEYEADLRCKDGSIRHVLIDSNSSWSNGKFLQTRCFTRDITDRKCAEEALRRSEQRFRAIFDGTFQFMGVLDHQGRLTGANRTALDAIAVNLEDVVGQLFWDTPWWTHSPGLQEQLKQAIARAAKGELVRFEAEHILADGTSIFVDFTLKPVFDEAGKVMMMIPEGRDISDRKQIEEALRESEQRLQAMLDNSTAVIYMKDVQGRYMMINRSYEVLFHLDRNEVKGKTDQDIFPKEIADVFQANDQDVIAAGVALETEEVAPQDDGLHTYLTIKFPLFDTGGTIYAVCGMSTDISDRKQAEVELQNQKQDLIRSNDELQQFAYVASHDLQEPLRMIISYLELLERRYKGQLDAKADQFIAYAVDGATRMQTLINDLLSYSRVGTRGQNFEFVDCNKVLQNVLANLRVAIAQSKAVVTHATLPQVNADPSQLTQLFQNLIGNAIKFKGEDPPQIHVGVESTNGKWLFSVQDNGIGIETQYLDRIFIIFQRLHSRTDYPGTGIGLAVCKKIVERHGGTFWVESQPGRGSTFYFTLPQSAGNPL